MPYCNMEGIRLYYEERGSGVPIIFVHPPGMGRKVFFYQLSLSNNFRVITFDLSGHGDTVGSRWPVTISGFCEEIRFLMDYLNIEKAVICGYSSGSAIAQELCLEMPERVLAVILSGGFAEVQSKIFEYEHLLGMYFVKHYPEFLAEVIATSHTEFLPLRTDLVKHMLKADRRVWFQFYKQSLHFSCLERLNRWERPLLLINGSKDFINQHLRAYRKKINCQEAFIKGASHQLPVRNWQAFNQIITGFVGANF